MKNFIFKSNENSDLLKIFTQLNMLLQEQRAQRVDLAWLKNQIKTLLNIIGQEQKPLVAEDLGFSDSEHGE